MIGPVVHGPPVASRVLLLGQAPGPREGSFGKPFAWTAGRTMFGWFERALGIDEERFRADRVHGGRGAMLPGQGERRRRSQARQRRGGSAARRGSRAKWPSSSRSSSLAVGTLAIERVLGAKAPLAEIVGTTRRARWHGRDVDVIPLASSERSLALAPDRARQDAARQGAAAPREASCDAGVGRVRG